MGQLAQPAPLISAIS